MEGSRYLDGFDVDQSVDGHVSSSVVRAIGVSTELRPSTSRLNVRRVAWRGMVKNVDEPPCCRGNSEPGVRRHCTECDKRKVRAEFVRLSNRYVYQIYCASHAGRASQHIPKCRRPSRSPEQSGGHGRSSKIVGKLSPFRKVSVPHHHLAFDNLKAYLVPRSIARVSPPVCLERWNRESRDRRWPNVSRAILRMASWATLANTAFRSSEKRVAEVRAKPSGCAVTISVRKGGD